MSDGEMLTEQPIREGTRCPSCGGQPESTVEHRLSALGYLHDDQRYTCAECGHGWTCGVPIGDFDRQEMSTDLHCQSCGTVMVVHRVEVGRNAPTGSVKLHLKCPNTDCHYFTHVHRDLDVDGCALVGNPRTAGRTAGADPYGYVIDE